MTKFLKNVDVAGYISQTLVTSALLKTDSSGKLIAATAGTDYQAPTTALLPTGGTAGQILSKIDATNYNTQWIDNFAAQLKHEVKLGATLTKGKAVYVSSANGTNMIVSAASNASEATSSKTLGLLETGGATNDIVKVITEGLLAGLDTSAATDGDPVWLGTSGNLIFGLANKPVAPAHLVFIGIVTRVQSENGEIFVKVQNGFELDELHNVALSSSANNQVLVYESATSLWKNKTIATILGYTPADDSAVVKLTGDQTIAGTKTFTTASHAAQLKFSESGGFSSTAGYTQIGGTASYFSFTNGANTKYAIFNYSGGGWTYTLPNSDGTLALVSQLSSYVPTTRTLTINGTALDLSQDRSWTVGVSGTARNEETFTTTSGQTNFTVTGGYTVGLVDVYVNGVKYAPADFTATTSPTVTISGLVTGDIVDIITYNTTLGNIAGSGTTNYVPKFTASGAIGNSAITDNGTTVALVSRALSGTTASMTTGFAAGSASATYPFNSISAAGTQAMLNSTRTGGGGVILQNNGSDRMYLGTANWAGVTGFDNTTSDLCLANAQNSSIVFAINMANASSGEKMQITNTGLLKLNSSNSAGIRFAGGASNLNYYEEGTFTPSNLNSNFGSVTPIWGRYVRIGNQVTVSCRWEVNASIGKRYLVFDLPYAFNNTSNITYIGSVSNYNAGVSSYSSNVGTSVRNTSGSATQQYVEAVYTVNDAANTLLFNMTYFTF